MHLAFKGMPQGYFNALWLIEVSDKKEFGAMKSRPSALHLAML